MCQTTSREDITKQLSECLYKGMLAQGVRIFTIDMPTQYFKIQTHSDIPRPLDFFFIFLI